jgi:regulatory protein
MKMDSEEIDEIAINSSNFLNEELCLQFCQGKHRIKQWGKIRITNELKFKINARNQHSP